MINQADQFEAEIERRSSLHLLPKAKNANASTEAPADETPPGGEESSADSAPAATAEDNASGAEDKDAPRVEEGAAERAQEDALNDEQEGDLEAAADQEMQWTKRKPLLLKLTMPCSTNIVVCSTFTKPAPSNKFTLVCAAQPLVASASNTTLPNLA